MSKYIYQIEKHVITEWIVTCQKEGDNLRTPIAKCNSQGIALTIKGLYEKYDEELENKSDEKEEKGIELENAQKKAARTGERKDLQEYLKMRRNYL